LGLLPLQIKYLKRKSYWRRYSLQKTQALPVSLGAPEW